MTEFYSRLIFQLYFEENQEDCREEILANAELSLKFVGETSNEKKLKFINKEEYLLAISSTKIGSPTSGRAIKYDNFIGKSQSKFHFIALTHTCALWRAL